MRLSIVSALAVNPTLISNERKAILKTTDGNVSVHTRVGGRPTISPSASRFEGRVPRTEYALTAAGRRPPRAGALPLSHGRADHDDAERRVSVRGRWLSMALAFAAISLPAQPPARLDVRLVRLIRPPLTFNIDQRNRVSLLPLFDGMRASIVVRHIAETFVFDPRGWAKRDASEGDTSSPALSAFHLETPPKLTQSQRDRLAADLTELVSIMAAQEKAHHFHLPRGVAAAREITPSVRVIDSDDPTIVRSNCGGKQPSIEISTGFVRRLLESAVERVNSSDMRMPEKPEGYSETEGNWPPALAQVYDYQHSRYGPRAGFTLGPTTQAIVRQLRLFDRDVYPAAVATLKKTGSKQTFEEYSTKFQPSNTTYGPAFRAAESLELPAMAKKRLTEIWVRLTELENALQNDPAHEAEREALGRQIEQGLEPAMEAILPLMNYTLMVEQEYLKALAFVLGHETAHIWFVGCGEDVDQENRADAFGVIVAFEMFANHHRRASVKSNAQILSPIRLGGDGKGEEIDPMQWLVDATGRSGVELMTSVYREIKVVDATHPSFEARNSAVQALYKQLVGTLVRPIGASQ